MSWVLSINSLFEVFTADKKLNVTKSGGCWFPELLNNKYISKPLLIMVSKSTKTKLNTNISFNFNLWNVKTVLKTGNRKHSHKEEK